jgi:hypothetical protein
VQCLPPVQCLAGAELVSVIVLAPQSACSSRFQGEQIQQTRARTSHTICRMRENREVLYSCQECDIAVQYPSSPTPRLPTQSSVSSKRGIAMSTQQLLLHASRSQSQAASMTRHYMTTRDSGHRHLHRVQGLCKIFPRCVSFFREW